MSNQNLSYVRYSDEVEVKQPDEEKTIEDIIASFERMRRFVYDKHRHALRGAHAKGHGAVKGVLKIYDNLPVELRQGIFREPRTYDVIIRFSNAPGDIIPDGVSSFLGMAIKVIGVVSCGVGILARLLYKTPLHVTGRDARSTRLPIPLIDD